MMLLLRLPGARRKTGRRNGSRGDVGKVVELCIFRFGISVIDTLVDLEGSWPSISHTVGEISDLMRCESGDSWLPRFRYLNSSKSTLIVGLSLKYCWLLWHWSWSLDQLRMLSMIFSIYFHRLIWGYLLCKAERYESRLSSPLISLLFEGGCGFTQCCDTAQGRKCCH
jgi:hypothetical protein